ncbi:hypothetical protein [Pseudomonas chlororaphis]|uniref:hypothetical protein n=1 Tax=Pseudomonas chlororaphis TaxID=587753 RepID=UPI001927DE6D|nr:hypothetical protein [Pseudomonas chlororaphis]QQX57556.1 hypothetical protein JHW28_23745 [Pseudomonas chlororaphis subsp. aurantiaca]
MTLTINHVPAALLKLPVVLTPRAWQAAVHVEDPQDAAEIGSRLAEVVLEAYKELHLQPDELQINFSLFLFPPAGDRAERIWLDLRLHRIESAPGTSYLCISLRDESPTHCR